MYLQNRTCRAAHDTYVLKWHYEVSVQWTPLINSMCQSHFVGGIHLSNIVAYAPEAIQHLQISRTWMFALIFEPFGVNGAP
jgi:hypothetical protein